MGYRDVANAESLSELTSQDVMDSRDLNKLLDELQAEKDAADEKPEDPDADKPEPFDADKAELLKALIELRDEFSSEWRHGETLIRESYFKTYAEQLAEDVGSIPDNAAWPCTCIDWKQAADELKQDYTSYEIGDVTYYARS